MLTKKESKKQLEDQDYRNVKKNLIKKILVKKPQMNLKS